jgi:D-arabinose 1-dehydrogenase-like Zn-dependent alcohol dehydrogenase
MSDYKFEAWVAEDISAAEGKMVWKEYQPKTWEERDLDIKISHSAICSTDLSVMHCAWVCQVPAEVAEAHAVVALMRRCWASLTWS